jgi:hypothetical protein
VTSRSVAGCQGGIAKCGDHGREVSALKLHRRQIHSNLDGLRPTGGIHAGLRSTQASIANDKSRLFASV